MATTVQILFFSELFQTLFVTMLLFWVDMPLFCKLLPILFMESFDQQMTQKFLDIHIDPNDTTYFVVDKTSDVIIHGIILVYILQIDYLEKYLDIFLALYLYSLLGFIFFLLCQQKSLFLYYPNFFLEVLTLFTMIEQFQFSEKCIFYLSIFVVIIKLIDNFHFYSTFKDEATQKFLR